MDDKTIIDISQNSGIFEIRDALAKYIYPVIKDKRPIIFLCIGTDRSTGDSLGPLVGDKLKFLTRDKIIIYGNLKNPVHAKNLVDTINEIYKEYSKPYIVAVDSCLGSIQNIGKVFIENRPLTPGAALNKELPTIGDISITGIVNISGALEFMVLQNTRLYTVMQLADAISKGIYHCILKTIGGKSSSVSKVNLNEDAIDDIIT